MRELMILLGVTVSLSACNDLPPPKVSPSAALAPALTRVGDEATLTATLDVKIQYPDSYKQLLRQGSVFLAFVYSPRPGASSSDYMYVGNVRANFPVSEVVEFLDAPPAGGRSPVVASTVDEGRGVATARFRLRAAKPGSAELRVGFALGAANGDPSTAGRTNDPFADAILTVDVNQ